MPLSGAGGASGPQQVNNENPDLIDVEDNDGAHIPALHQDNNKCDDDIVEVEPSPASKVRVPTTFTTCLVICVPYRCCEVRRPVGEKSVILVLRHLRNLI
jgi:hypothetical protein